MIANGGEFLVHGSSDEAEHVPDLGLDVLSTKASVRARSNPSSTVTINLIEYDMDGLILHGQDHGCMDQLHKVSCHVFENILIIRLIKRRPG